MLSAALSARSNDPGGTGGTKLRCFSSDSYVFKAKHEVYGFRGPLVLPFSGHYDYAAEFSKVPKIAEIDLSEVVRGVSFWCDGRAIRRCTSSKNSNYL